MTDDDDGRRHTLNPFYLLNSWEYTHNSSWTRRTSFVMQMHTGTTNRRSTLLPPNFFWIPFYQNSPPWQLRYRILTQNWMTGVINNAAWQQRTIVVIVHMASYWCLHLPRPPCIPDAGDGLQLEGGDGAADLIVDDYCIVLSGGWKVLAWTWHCWYPSPTWRRQHRPSLGTLSLGGPVPRQLQAWNFPD